MKAQQKVGIVRGERQAPVTTAPTLRKEGYKYFHGDVEVAAFKQIGYKEPPAKLVEYMLKEASSFHVINKPFLAVLPADDTYSAHMFVLADPNYGSPRNYEPVYTMMEGIIGGYKLALPPCKPYSITYQQDLPNARAKTEYFVTQAEVDTRYKELRERSDKTQIDYLFKNNKGEFKLWFDGADYDPERANHF